MRVVRDPVCHLSNCRKKLGPATPRVFSGGVWWCANWAVGLSGAVGRECV